MYAMQVFYIYSVYCTLKGHYRFARVKKETSFAKLLGTAHTRRLLNLCLRRKLSVDVHGPSGFSSLPRSCFEYWHKKSLQA